jgi:cyclic beta-1,2-glucan synthetase
MLLKQSISLNILDDVKLSSQELIKYAYELSLIHKVYSKNMEYRHISLGEASRNIENAYSSARQGKYDGVELPALSEWFYDNRYLFLEQIKQIELKKETYRLPHIKNGKFAHYPRSFALAIELAKHSSFYITVSNIQEFLEAYQKEAELDSGELWVFVDMLKIAIICAVSELAKRSIESLKMRRRAEKFYAQAEDGTQTLESLISENKGVLSSPQFIEHLTVLFRESQHMGEVAEKINKRLAARNLSIDKLVAKAHAAQAMNIMYISNALSSLRMLAKINFEAIFEGISAVHRHLSEDECYVAMDFNSREYYRKGVTEIASIINVSEPAVAKAAISLAKSSGEHVGEYLRGAKRHDLMREFAKVPFKERATSFVKRHMLLFYAGGALVSTIVSAGLLCISLFFMYPPVYGIIGFLLRLIPIYAVAAAINNRIFTMINKPAFIPKMSLKKGIPPESATMVAVTSLLTSLEDGRELLEKMQVYYAANQHDNLYFMLLSDFKEDKNEINAQEVEIIEKIEEEINALNSKYGKKLFFYAQRKRTYIPSQKKFSGKERKRGALLELCSLLRGDDKGFMHVSKDIPQGIKYVITLDTDTELSRDAAVKMIGAMEHPLNQPRIDPATNTVKRGFGIMQPRIGIDVVCAAKTRFSLVFSGKGGLDTYACAASDVYQDGFGTGIYTGKGIFEVDIYAKVLKNAFPDDAILSHDLLEGGYARCALLSDVVLMDGYPTKYLSWAQRQHRWVRGDWQLLPWLKGNVRTKDGRIKNPLSALTKYQIIDNIRRSLVVPLSFVVILLSQTAFYRSAFFWFISGILPLFIDGLLDFGSRIIVLIRNTGKGTTLKDAWYETKTLFEQSFYKFAFLAYETYLMLDAIVRTIVRMAVTKKNMLEWVTAAEREKHAEDGVSYYWKKMRAAPVLAVVLYALSLIATGTFSLIAFLIFAVWFFAPSIAYLISRPRKIKKYTLDERQKEYLEDIALKTWRFFEKYGAENEYCWMPDNYQHSPKKGAALRTSPTNIAFSMTSGLAAYYMGFITLPEALGRLERCVQGIEKAPKWQGHLYNWYDITDLTPLEPKYVSSVDSGNLACYLIVALEAINDMLNYPIAGNMHKGIKAMLRESGQPDALLDGQDLFDSGIYDSMRLIGMIGEDSAPLSAYKKAFECYYDKYAKWAPKLLTFESPHTSMYLDIINALQIKLGAISVNRYISEFNEVLELLSEIYEKAAGLRDDKALEWIKSMETALGESYVACRRLTLRMERLTRRIKALFDAMDFAALYDEGKGLFSIGFDERQNRLSDTHYDLLASEARQTGFIAIAKGDVPGKHWFRLARPLTVAGDNRVLLSWGGTMFEYLMPLIIMKSYDNTLLGETYITVVNMQSDYGEQRRVPWGVSESGYYAFDLQMNYQYKAFGVPGLGMRSGLVREVVVSPYSVFLALHVNAKAAVHNLERLEKIGALGKYGFYEAVDYTQARMQKGKKKRIVKSYMAHHQGMILASILNCLQDDKLQELFHSSMCVKATEMLLKEKVPPRNITLSLGEKQPEHNEFAEEIHSVRTFKHFVQYPEAHFLSNGNYTVMLTQYGTGYSMYRYKMVNRWYSDYLRTAPGIHVYIRDNDTGAVWSAAMLPTCVRADQERAVFEPHKAAYVREIGDITTTLEVCVSPEYDMEIRNLEINNKSDREANISVMCAFTPALCRQPDFEAHPAFTELFLETEVDADAKTIFARRRNKCVYSAMKLCAQGSAEFITDRAGIFGRKNIFGVPACMTGYGGKQDVARALGIKCDISVPAKSTGSVAFVIAAGECKQDVIQSLSVISGEDDVKRTFHLAWTHSQVEMRYLKLKDMQADLFQRIASRTVIKIPCEHTLSSEADGVQTLWCLGISGDLPIICMFAHDREHMDVVKTVVKAQEFMSHRCVKADLVIIYDGGAEYINPLRDKLKEFEQASSGRPYNRVYAIARDCATEKQVATLLSASCLVLEDRAPLHEQLKVPIKMNALYIFEQEKTRERARAPRRIKAFDNGTGGYISGGTEYCIDVEDYPLPWSNILVNKSFGTLISAGGGGYTWAENAQMKRLTPFRNDPLTDINAEGILIRNDRTGAVFSIMPDSYASGKYRVIHGIGYTVSERYGGVSSSATFFVDTRLPVKATLLEISNNTNRSDGFSVYYFAEPGIARGCRSIKARFNGNRLEASSNFDDPNKAMFIAMPRQNVNYTTSAFEFFGALGNNILPEAVKVKELSNTLGAASLLALQAHITLEPGESKSVAALLGYGDAKQADDILGELGDELKIKQRLGEVKAYWKRLTGGITVATQNKSFDTLVNNWLVYQTYASRIWGRTGYYQSGGAYGFRDQLQDVLSLVYTNPAITREIIVKFAARQFVEGDVMHWWHEPVHGVRTRISDDKLFLPFVACEYERITGDMSVFDENVPYLEGKEIPEGTHDIYEEFCSSDITENVFSHCVRAIDSALKFGEHGLPLIGTGDWNDGMNKIGEKGKGESVWLAFFLTEVLRMFAALCRRRGEDALSKMYEEKREELRANIENNAWDGDWYMRAFFDDGTPVGCRGSQECSIDLVSQAWAVISGAARARKAFLSAERQLVMSEEGVIRLLKPAFDKWEKDPGYIKSYLPGVRENGGQYSHAAVWFVIAAAKLREKDKAFRLFQLLNPINHTRTPADVARYKGEPYVMAADVYYTADYKGRAGWTWYTGAAGWMYQAAIVHLLGIHIERGELSVYPCVPDNFGKYTVEYRRDKALYVITVVITPGYEGPAELSIDGKAKGKSAALDIKEGRCEIYACWK